MIIDADSKDPLSVYTDIVNKGTGKSHHEENLLIFSWNTTTKEALLHLYDEKMGLKLDPNTHQPIERKVILPNYKTVFKFFVTTPEFLIDRAKELAKTDSDIEIVIKPWKKK